MTVLLVPIPFNRFNCRPLLVTSLSRFGVFDTVFLPPAHTWAIPAGLFSHTYLYPNSLATALPNEPPNETQGTLTHTDCSQLNWVCPVCPLYYDLRQCGNLR